MTTPVSPIDAVTHRDPYPYYAGLVERRPLYRDESLGCWVASSAEAVTAVLESELCRVRPPDEPVPRAIAGTAAGEVFRHLARMNDGAGHCPLKRAISATLSGIGVDRVREVSRECARVLVDELEPASDPWHVDELAFRLPVDVVGTLLGLPRERLGETAAAVEDYVGCLAPSADPARIERGTTAAARLLDLVSERLTRASRLAPETLLSSLAATMRANGVEASEVIVANAVGLLSQSYEATAGLVSNTLVALARRPDARGRLVAAVDETLRHDAPVQNTRRFVARAGAVAGQEMAEGDVVLVVLAAANRDPAANPDPERFDLDRVARRQFVFGDGSHACPGSALSRTIAVAGVDRLLACGIDMERFAAPVAYRPSANTRVARFGHAERRKEALA